MKYFYFLYFYSIISFIQCEIENIIFRERMIELANYINKINTSWTAKIPNRDYSAFLGYLPKKKGKDEVILQSVNRKESSSKNRGLPQSYDARIAHPECFEIISEIPDQANCGSCWAIASASVMSDRLCIKSGGKIKKFVSALDLLSCCNTCGKGCNGGNPQSAFEYWIEKGIVTGGKHNDKNSCRPYFLPECDHHMKTEILGPCPKRVNTPSCEVICLNEYNKNYEEDKTYGKSVYSIWAYEEEIMKEIYENGPVVSSYDVYEDFYVYDSGIYKHETGQFEAGHSVRILGWGVENGIKYWLVSNSWNKNWGLEGTFKILKGNNECNIEENVIAGLPKTKE